MIEALLSVERVKEATQITLARVAFAKRKRFSGAYGLDHAKMSDAERFDMDFTGTLAESAAELVTGRRWARTIGSDRKKPDVGEFHVRGTHARNPGHLRVSPGEDPGGVFLGVWVSENIVGGTVRCKVIGTIRGLNAMKYPLRRLDKDQKRAEAHWVPMTDQDLMPIEIYLEFTKKG